MNECTLVQFCCYKCIYGERERVKARCRIERFCALFLFFASPLPNPSHRTHKASSHKDPLDGQHQRPDHVSTTPTHTLSPSCLPSPPPSIPCTAPNLTMSISLDSLIQRDRKDLADLTLDISKSDKDTRANKATNQGKRFCASFTIT